MKTGELSEAKLAAIIAFATLFGGIVSSIISSLLIDADTERQTDIQLVELAIGILSEPLPEKTETSWPSLRDDKQDAKTALRKWAVDTINQSADVRFDENAQNILINGKASLPAPDLKQLMLK